MPSTLDDIRELRVSVVHPWDRDCDVLIRQLQRLGARPVQVWPLQAADQPSELLFCLVDRETRALAALRPQVDNVTLIGIVEPTNALSQQLLAELCPHAVLTRPVDPAAVASCILVAQSNARFQSRLQAKIGKLEERLRTSRKVDQAKAILMEKRHMAEPQAFAFLREQAMKKRVSIGTVAAIVIESNEVLPNDPAL